MSGLLLVVTLLQEPDYEALLRRYGDNDPAVSEKAYKELVALTPRAAPKLVHVYRTASSPEVRALAERYLARSCWFATLAETREDEAMHKAVRAKYLEDVEKHRRSAPVDCWSDWERPLDVTRLSIRSQGGSGHAGTLVLTNIRPDGKGGLTCRRITSRRLAIHNQEKREGVTVQETRLDARWAEALASLLRPAVRLKPACAVRQDKNTTTWMSIDFTTRLQITSGGNTLFAAAYTGYVSSDHRHEYEHGGFVDRIVDEALLEVPFANGWTETKLDDAGHSDLLGWIRANFAREGWWVRESYLNIGRFIGNKSWLPFLRSIVSDLASKSGPSEDRQRETALATITRIELEDK